MIKKTLYFGNPVYLSLRNAQLVIKLPDVEKATVLPETLKKQAEVTKPIEDIGIVVLDNKQEYASRINASSLWKYYAE